MLRYETLFLIRTEATDEEMSMIEKHLDKLVGDAQGTFKSFDKWGKYRLAYPVKKNTHGLYVLARYDLSSQQADNVLSDVDKFIKIKCHEIVMRYVTIRLKEDAPSTYIKPDAVGMSQTGSFDTFFKENKIENLLNSVETSDNIDDIEENA